MRGLRLPLISCASICLASAQSAGTMVSACKQVTTAKTSDRVTLLPQDFNSGLCWGAFGAFEQFAKASNGAKGQYQPALGICVPENTPRSRLIAVFAEFAKRHPDRNQEDFYPVARDALKAAFPCRARSLRNKL